MVFLLYSVALLDYYHKLLPGTSLLSEISENSCIPQETLAMLTCPQDGNCTVSLPFMSVVSTAAEFIIYIPQV
uniref:Uncharacterized protein n=1 Tax=Setaria italica TaxID=4555 RepID=K3XU11_SETIT